MFRNFLEPGREVFVITPVRTALVGALAAALIPLATSPATAQRQPGGDGTVDFGQYLQPIDGFGFSQAFQRADVVHGAQGLTPRHQREVLDLLLNRATGAGLSILRLGIGSSSDEVYDHMKSIQPTDPGGPDKAIGPTVRRAGINLVCCDAAGWDEQASYSAAIEADKEAADQVAVHTGHPYVTPSDQPLPTSRRTWMSEWSPNGTTWNEAWDDRSGYDGFAVAEAIHTTLADAGASAYVYWFGASVGATRSLIQLDGPGYHVSKRLWALAAYSRFIRPGAVRVAADSGADGVRTTAFRNRDGQRVLEILNTGEGTVRTDYALRGADTGDARGAVYRTDDTHALSRIGTARVHDGRLAVELPGRSLTTVVLR